MLTDRSTAERGTAVDNQSVKVMIARALIEPDYLPDRDEPETCERPPIDDRRLGLVAAFVSKVQNNDLWEIMPRSRALLRACGCELAVFAEFRRRQARDRAPVLERAAAFVALLADPALSLPDECRPIAELARHEYMLTAMSREPSGHDPGGEESTSRLHPRLGRSVAIQAYRWDPIALGDVALDLDGAPPFGEAEHTFLGYRVDRATAAVQVLRLEPAVALVLSLADGTRSAADIARSADAGIDAEITSEILASASRAGLLEGVSAKASAPDAVLDVIRGHTTGRLLWTLESSGALAMLTEPRTVAELADALGIDHGWLRPVFTYLTAHSVLGERPGDRYVLELDAEAYDRLAVELRKFIGAYGGCLDRPAPAPDLVDEAALAGAFVRVSQEQRARPHAPTLLQRVLADHDVASTVVDLGCGPGDLLVDLALADEEFHGIGLDANPAMADAARTNAIAAGVASRITFVVGDAEASLQSLDAAILEPVQSIHAGSFFNALFRHGSARAIETLKLLRSLLPARILLVNDYYGEYCNDSRPSGEHAWAELQDLVQVASGQGIPPPTREDWFALYEQAGCEVVADHEIEERGVRRFVHVVRLCGAP